MGYRLDGLAASCPTSPPTSHAPGAGRSCSPAWLGWEPSGAPWPCSVAPEPCPSSCVTRGTPCPAAPPSLSPPLPSSHTGAESRGKRDGWSCVGGSRLLSWMVVSSRCGVSSVCKAAARRRCAEIKGFNNLLARWNRKRQSSADAPGHSHAPEIPPNPLASTVNPSKRVWGRPCSPRIQGLTPHLPSQVTTDLSVTSCQGAFHSVPRAAPERIKS